MNEKNISTITNRVLIYSLLIIGSIVFFIPFVWLICTSLKPIEQTMSMPVTFLPRAYYIEHNGSQMKVRKDIEITYNGYMVRILEGEKKDNVLIIPEKDFSDNKAKLVIQESDKVFEKWVRCEMVKEIDKGWIKVVEVFDEGYSKGEPLWDVVPSEKIKKRIKFQWSNYTVLFKKIPFFIYLKNTLIVALVGTFAMTISSALVAYGFSRIEWKGRDFFFALSIATMMVPFPVTMIPLYSVFKAFGMVGTLRPLWVPTFFASAFNIFLLRQFFIGLPYDIDEAARIDGCNEFQIFYKIILPLSKPALAVVALFHFMYAWNDFMGPLIYLNRPETFTLSLGLQQFQSKSGGTDWHLLMAMSTLIILPIIILFFLSQKTFIQGISLTGSKE